MHSCEMHPSGALLLPFLRLPTHMLSVLPVASTAGGAFLPIPMFEGAGDSALEEGDTLGNGFDNDDDGDMGMPDADDGAAGGWEEALAESGLPSDGPLDESAAAVDRDSSGELAPPQSPPRAGQREEKPRPPAPAPAWDPWAPLDPHDAGGAALRPFRRCAGGCVSQDRTGGLPGLPPACGCCGLECSPGSDPEELLTS